MKTIKIYFTDFSIDFNIKDDFFYILLSMSYEIILDRENPDYLIYSCYGFDYLKYDCVRIFYTAENIRPDFNLCDYAIGFDKMCFADRYMRFPNYARYGEQFKSITRKETLTVDFLDTKPGFCNFVYSNAKADPKRDQLFHLLSKYKKVDSAGRHLKNVCTKAGDRFTTAWRDTKVEFQRGYKFSIAFENSSTPGYTTEKIMHAFAANTVPIYWGNPDIACEFNPKAFINGHEYSNINQIVERIVQMDSDDELYLQTLNEPCFIGGNIPYVLSENAMTSFFRAIFEQPLSDARRRAQYGSTLIYEKDIKISAALIKKKRVAVKLCNQLFDRLKHVMR